MNILIKKVLSELTLPDQSSQFISMFTGLIQSIGQIRTKNNCVQIDGCKPFSPLTLGDSISVDGVCLTVADLSFNGFLANVSEETLTRTNLGKKAENGGLVNLEPALRLSDRLGGHLVSGHVDGLGEIISLERLPNSWSLKVRWQNIYFGKYVCDKASIALNGISLTVSSAIEEGSSFLIAVIPHTWENTSLQYLNKGELVNLEADLMAKYAEKLIKNIDQPVSKYRETTKNISRTWLEEQGWG